MKANGMLHAPAALYPMVTGSDFLRVKQEELEADHSAPSSIKTRLVEPYLHPFMSLHGIILHYLGACGSVAVEELRYKPEGRRFETR
jgi:hypothetical protein